MSNESVFGEQKAWNADARPIAMGGWRWSTWTTQPGRPSGLGSR